MKLGQVIRVLEQLAPPRLAESWDRVGLAVGSVGRNIRRAMLCIDLTQAVLDEALGCKVDLVVAYHPPIFEPLEALTDGPTRQRIILRAAEAKIAIYSPHTALDSAPGGVNDFLAQAVGEGDVQPIRPAGGGQSKAFKLVTFVPLDQADALRSALAAAGAGHIGHYSDCSFSVIGQGTFRGDQTTHPTVGKAGRFETAQELRMEMLVPADRLEAALAALRHAHPYEEPAFDVYPLEPAIELSGAPGSGPGRIVELNKPISLATLTQRIKKALGVKMIQVARPTGPSAPIRRVGVCAGAGGSLLGEAGQLDAFVTGEMRHHAILDAVAQRTAILLAGHTQTERPYLKVYRQRIIAAGGKPIAWHVSRADRAPLSAS